MGGRPMHVDGPGCWARTGRHSDCARGVRPALSRSFAIASMMSAFRLGERSSVTAQLLEAQAQVEVQGGLVLGMERELKLGFTGFEEIQHDIADQRLR